MARTQQGRKPKGKSSPEGRAEGGREGGRAAVSERTWGGEARPSRMNGRREGGAGSVRRGGGLLAHQVTDGAAHLHPTLPSAHLPSSGPGEPPWAALGPRQSRGRGGACRAVDQQPGPLFHNRSREPPQSAGLTPTLLPATRRGPGDKAPGAGSGQTESSRHHRVWKSHPGILLRPLSPLLLPPPRLSRSAPARGWVMGEPTKRMGKRRARQEADLPQRGSRLGPVDTGAT